MAIRPMLLALLGWSIVGTSGLAAPFPELYSSDAEHDRLLNDLFIRHLRIDESATSLRSGSLAPGVGTVLLWRDWEVDELLWFDYGPNNLPQEDRRQHFRGILQSIPIDRFGYVFTSHAGNTPTTDGPDVWFGMGWPFPRYSLSYGAALGWEFNGADNEGWSINNIEASYVGSGEWGIQSALVDPHVVSPAISVDAMHAPFVEMILRYTHVDPQASAGERVFQFFWATE